MYYDLPSYVVIVWGNTSESCTQSHEK